MKLGAFFVEILPLLAFFVGYQYLGLIAAAVLSVGIGGLVLGVVWLRERRVAAFPLFSLLLSAAFTAAALAFGDGIFIKIQPTIFNGMFAVVLLGGLLSGRAMMRLFFAGQFSLTEGTWRLLSLRWGCFFLVLAFANEIVWRGFDEAEWVFYKTFIAAPASALFMLAQLPLTLRGRLSAADDPAPSPDQ
ncbi:MAG: inner membrane-spanning protein YciB [Candidatus Puniceispirillaceae bacterium]